MTIEIIDIKDIFKKPYTNKADELLVHEKSDAIKVDHLAFSFKLSSLRKCSKAGLAFKQSIFPKVPEIKSYFANDLESFDQYKAKVNHELMEFYENTLIAFCDYVLGMELGLTTGKGFHGYKDSMNLKANGQQVGIVGIGGQRDTVYFQISGDGCKHLFSHITYFNLHHWLNKVLDITTLSRLDLAYDDFDGNFDSDYAFTSHHDGFFKTNPNARQSKIDYWGTIVPDENNKPTQKIKMVTVGSRTSAIYWRIYDKKLEQFEKGNKDFKGLQWWRSEVELKKWTSDALLNVAAAFAGICPYAAQCELDKGIKTSQRNKTNEACTELASRVRHVRRSAGRALNDLLDICEGDFMKVLGLIVPDETATKFGIPNTHKQLVKHAIGI